MAKYDFKKAKKIIEDKMGEISSASLGMHEDWFWTAEQVFIDGEFIIDLDGVTQIAGIGGSGWATPVLQMEYKDGSEEVVPCYKGDDKPSGKPDFDFLMHGVLSGPAQANRPQLKEERK
jgi:hypothetical protein